MFWLPMVTLPLLAIVPSRADTFEAVGVLGVGVAVEVVVGFAERCFGAMIEGRVKAGSQW